MTKASLQSARKRLQTFPKLLTNCNAEAAIYGKCVARKHEDIAPNTCLKEFQLFKECLNNAAKTMKIKI